MSIRNWLCCGTLAAGLCACTPQGDFYVSVDGDDANPGTAARPFATVARARDAVRELRARAPARTQPVVVRVGAGTYFLKEPLVFSPEDSGPVGYIGAEKGETLLSGGVPISGWRETAPGRWETHLPDVAAGVWNFSQLYVNDQRRPRPLLPKAGYFTIGGAVAPTAGAKPDRFRFREGEIRADWTNLGDVEVTTFHLWTMDRLRIKSVDAAQRIVTFTGPTHSEKQAQLSRGTWYRIENVREALTQPGEWYLDRRTGILTVLAMPGEDLRTARVVAPRLAHVVRFEGRAGAPVRDILLRGLTLAHNAWNTPDKGYGFPQADVAVGGAVEARYATGCGLEDCVVRHTGTYAVNWGDGCHRDAVRNCELFDLGVGGVKIGPTQLGWEAGTNKWASGCTVTDTSIRHGGRVLPAGIGVWIGHAASNEIVGNVVSDFYYSGMSVGWRWGAGFSPAHHNRIEGNHIYNIGQGVLSDMAGIYTLGESPGTVLRGNWIHDVSRARYGGWGMYFDEGSSGIVAECNLVLRTEDAGQFQNYGRENRVRNNILAFGTNATFHVGNPREENSIHFERNLCYGLVPDPVRLGRLNDGMTFASNLYWRADGGPVETILGKKVEAWRAREPGFIIADPLFVAPERDDFRLKPGSPADRIGFVAFDARGAGRSARTSKTAKLPPVLRVFPPAPAEIEAYRNLVIDEDFEAYSPGQPLGEIETHLSPGDRAEVVAGPAAGGRQSLHFREGPPTDASWTPHICAKVRYDEGLVRAGFDLRHEPGARVIYEWRDWPTSHGGSYKTGPLLVVSAAGVLTAGGKDLLTLPAGAWVHIELTCGLGSRASGAYGVTVTVPGAPARTFDGLRHPDGFKALDWVGFSSSGKEGAQYHIDNLKLAPAPAP